MMTTMSSSDKNRGQLGDTTLTKLFVGGLAWETPREAMRQHFEKYGEILEAVIISDKFTGRSKGYGFVTFKEAEAAKKACEDPNPIINGRRANCNLASLGARRPTNSPRSSLRGRPRNTTASTAANQVQWYYPVGTPASPYHHQPVPLYGYNPTYIPTNPNYNQKLSYGGGGAYMNMNGQMCQMQNQRPAMMGGNALMPMYPLCQFHQSHAMGVPAAHFFQPTMPMPAAIMPKPPAIPPATGTTGAG